MGKLPLFYIWYKVNNNGGSGKLIRALNKGHAIVEAAEFMLKDYPLARVNSDTGYGVTQLAEEDQS